MDTEALQLMTVDQLMSLGSEAHIEVIDGEVVEMSPVGGLHHVVAGNIHDILKFYVKQNDLGFVFMDGLLYLLHKIDEGIKGARVPDVSYIRKENIPKDWQLEKPFPGAPDLAVEVMSPNDSANATLKRVRDYLDAGTEDVWVVYPEQKEVHQYQGRLPTVANLYQNDDRIAAENLFPGLEIITASFFVLPDWMKSLE